MDNKQTNKINIFWPTISDIRSAKAAGMLGVWASIAVAFFTAIAIIFKLANTDVSSLWDVLGALIIAWAIFKMSRTGAVLGLLIYVVGRIVISFEMSILSTGWLFVLWYINSIRGTFAYHRFALQEAKDNPSLIKPKLKYSKLGKYSILIFIGAVFIIIASIVLNELKPELRVTKILGMVAALGGIIGSLIGSILGVIGIFQKNRKLLLPILGLILNTGMLAIFFYYIAIGFSQKP